MQGSHNSFARPDEQMGRNSFGFSRYMRKHLRAATPYNKAIKKVANARRRRRDRGIARFER